ncbi:MAG TPA: AraC family transcriptional regulator, partial [Edaphobacter sp.]|nr:AraC family transcriptional regulator [Edaphobacter sp.]
AVKAPGWINAMRQDIFGLLLYAVRNEAHLFQVKSSMESQPLLPRFLPVLDWIDQNIASNEITVADLARRAFISETHFRRMFLKTFEMSPMQFVRKRRIERACTLLRTTDTPIKQIAQDCGFAEDAFFSRVFRHLVGVTPAAYRRGEYPNSAQQGG